MRYSSKPVKRSLAFMYYLVGLITVIDAILPGRLGGQKLQCLYGNRMANNLLEILNFAQLMNRNFTRLGTRLCLPNMKDVAIDVQLIFQFPIPLYIFLPRAASTQIDSWAEKSLLNLQTNVWKNSVLY